MKNIARAAKEDEISDFRELVFAQLEATWSGIEWAKRAADLPADERDRLTLWWLLCFAAERAAAEDMSGDDLSVAMREAYKLAVESDIDPEAPIPFTTTPLVG